MRTGIVIAIGLALCTSVALAEEKAAAEASACDYIDMSPGPDIEAAVVRAVVPKLQVRKAGPESPVIGTLTQKQWVTVKGHCDGTYWFKIADGYGEGWIHKLYTCQQPREPNVILSPRQEIEEYLHPEPDVWRVTIDCGHGHSDEQIAAEGQKILAESPVPQEPEPQEIHVDPSTDTSPEAIAVPSGGAVKCEDFGTVEDHHVRCRHMDSPTGE